MAVLRWEFCKRLLIVSKKANHAEQIVADFNKGLAIIEKDGTLKRIYRESGF